MSVQVTQARMAAPTTVKGLNVFAWVSNGVSSGYALLDDQYATSHKFVVTLVIMHDDGELVRSQGHYSRTFSEAMNTFAIRASEIAADEMVWEAKRTERGY